MFPGTECEWLLFLLPAFSLSLFLVFHLFPVIFFLPTLPSGLATLLRRLCERNRLAINARVRVIVLVVFCYKYAVGGGAAAPAAVEGGAE